MEYTQYQLFVYGAGAYGRTIITIVATSEEEFLQTTIKELKKKIEAINGFEPDMYRLIFNSQDLEDDEKTLKDYHIKNHSTIFHVIRMSGGGPEPV